MTDGIPEEVRLEDYDLGYGAAFVLGILLAGAAFFRFYGEVQEDFQDCAFRHPPDQIDLKCAISAGDYVICGTLTTLGFCAPFLALRWVRSSSRESVRAKTLEAFATRVGLEKEQGGFRGLFEGVPVAAYEAGGAIELVARVQPGEPGLRVSPRRGGEGGRTGNPLLDMLATAEGASPALVGRLGDPSNAEPVMRLLHGYTDWSIAGDSEETTITVRFADAADEYTLEHALRVLAAVARVLAAAEG